MGEIMDILINTLIYTAVFFVYLLLNVFVIWSGAAITKVDILWRHIFITAIVMAGMSFIPGIFAGIISTIVFFTLLKIFTGEDIWPDLVLLAVVGRIMAVLGGIFISGIILHAAEAV